MHAGAIEEFPDRGGGNERGLTVCGRRPCRYGRRQIDHADQLALAVERGAADKSARRIGIEQHARAVDTAQPGAGGRDIARARLRFGLGGAAWVEPQWGPIAIFAVLLVAALATIAWMARLLLAK